ncbi:hypothetical protein GQ44DRAFT_217010 [Phaeosphaeriaceae sp. PMI808]|nr:hypothetical protein GQ44DRAFT_217010 [Phaeosphaeriaceae sp. PMI808]
MTKRPWEFDPYVAMALIKRVERTSDETPPWKGIIFTLPVGSDVLSEELKRAHPGCSTLRERKHMAAIEFLQAELRQMQSPVDITAQNGDIATPDASSIYSDPLDGCSSLESVSMRRSPSTTTKDLPTVEAMQQKDLTPASTHLSPSMSSIINPAQQFVFSLIDGRPQQPKNSKRRMTRDEKIAYKKTRKRGACPRCRRQKGKCTHVVDGSAEADDLGGSPNAKKRKLPIIGILAQEQENRVPNQIQLTEISRPNSDPSSHPPQGLSEIVHGSNDPQIQHGPVNDTPHWGGETAEGLQTEIPRYVPNQPDGEPFRMCVPGEPELEPEPEWIDFNPFPDISHYNPGYSSFQAPGIPRDDGLAGMTNSYQYTLPHVHVPDTESQAYHQDQPEDG